MFLDQLLGTPTMILLSCHTIFGSYSFIPCQRKCSQKSNLAKARMKRQYISSASCVYSSEPLSADMRPHLDCGIFFLESCVFPVKLNCLL
uniref:Uncharacterized protein n=1 Tax=Arundo donax TaxID=35708 RepID=A0A0A9EA53_ARUDO